MTELKPCPFCGNTPTIKNDGDGGIVYFEHECAFIRIERVSDGNTLNHFCECWNTRAPTPALTLAKDKIMQDVRLERAFLDGMLAGWNLGNSGYIEEYNQIQTARRNDISKALAAIKQMEG